VLELAGAHVDGTYGDERGGCSDYDGSGSCVLAHDCLDSDLLCPLEGESGWVSCSSKEASVPFCGENHPLFLNKDLISKI